MNSYPTPASFIVLTEDLFSPLIDAALFYPLTPQLTPYPLTPLVSAHVLGPEAGGVGEGQYENRGGQSHPEVETREGSVRVIPGLCLRGLMLPPPCLCGPSLGLLGASSAVSTLLRRGPGVTGPALPAEF